MRTSTLHTRGGASALGPIAEPLCSRRMTLLGLCGSRPLMLAAGCANPADPHGDVAYGETVR